MKTRCEEFTTLGYRCARPAKYRYSIWRGRRGELGRVSIATCTIHTVVSKRQPQYRLSDLETGAEVPA